MTNEHMLEDLKQFITATVTQQTSDIRGDIAQVKDDLIEVKSDLAEVKGKVEKLRQEMSDGFAGIAATIETINTQVDDLEDKAGKADIRLTRLEHRAA